MNFNLTYLKSISGGDENFIRDILMMFLEHTMSDLGILKQEMNNKNLVEVASAAHKIKSSVMMLGNEEATDLVLTIEQEARGEGSVDGLTELTKKLDRVLNQIAADIKTFIHAL